MTQYSMIQQELTLSLMKLYEFITLGCWGYGNHLLLKYNAIINLHVCIAYGCTIIAMHSVQEHVHSTICP